MSNQCYPGYVRTTGITVECNIGWAKANPELALKSAQDFYAEARLNKLPVRPINTTFRKGHYYLIAGQFAL